MSMALISVIIVIIALLPFIIERLRLPMDEQARADAPGQFINLSRGVTHYRYFGPQDGPFVVCVHGLTTPSYAYEAVGAALAQKGFRVLCYDHYGRGYSDRPKGDQTRDFYVSHLNELLDRLGHKEAFDLVGYSMGGWIVSAYASANVERVKRLFLLTPAGMGHELGWVANLIKKVPYFGDWLFLLSYGRQHLHGTEAERDIEISVPYVIDRQQRELIYRGFLPSVLASLRGGVDETTQIDHVFLKQKNLPTTAIWGANDDVIPLSCKARLETWNADVRHIVVDGCGHSLPYSHPHVVVDAIVNDVSN